MWTRFLLAVTAISVLTGCPGNGVRAPDPVEPVRADTVEVRSIRIDVPDALFFALVTASRRWRMSVPEYIKRTMANKLDVELPT